MNDKDEMEALFMAVGEEQRKMEQRYVDEAIIGGATDAAKLLDDSAVRDQIGQMAFQRTLARQSKDGIKPPPRPGPARRAKKRPKIGRAHV